MMDSQAEISGIPSPQPLDTTITHDEAELSTVCDVCKDLVSLDHNDRVIWIGRDILQTKNSCPSCAVFWTILTPYRHLIGSHKTTWGEGSILIWHEDTFGLRIGVRVSASHKVFQVFTTNESENACPFPYIQPMTLISQDTGSDEAFAKISQWLQECVQRHQNCNAVQPPVSLPKRLVEILGPEKVVLRTIDTDMVGSYVALSHCWGTKHFIQTTKSTLPQYQDHVSWNDLPRTFKDAIDVTRRLGIRYMWIDSLCIIQDDDDDWRTEGSKMASIYSGSYVTIAASKSADSAGGCFAKAASDATRTYGFFNANKQQYTVHVREEIKHPTAIAADFPLFNRAWVLQERLLSPRTIHFGPRELLWECAESRECECGGWKTNIQTAPIKDVLRSNSSKTSLDPFMAPEARWRRIVAEYSTLKLSHERDIFPAIQGIAKSFHEEMQCAYHAGLWENSLFADLLWRSSSTTGRSKIWRAPTWSWASTDEIRWVTGFDLPALASIVAIHTYPVGTDPFGEISGGELKLKGRYIDAMLMEWKPEKHRSIHLKLMNGDREVVLLTSLDFHADDVSSLRGDTTSKLVEIGTADRAAYYYYLVLQCVNEEQQVYERIGIVEMRCPRKEEVLRYFEQHGEELVFTVV